MRLSEGESKRLLEASQRLEIERGFEGFGKSVETVTLLPASGFIFEDLWQKKVE